MGNRLASNPATPQIPLPHRHGGIVEAGYQLAINNLGDTYFVKGSRAIRELPALPPGPPVDLIILDAPTFVHSSRLLLPGGTNRTFKSGDLVRVVPIGDGIWRVWPLVLPTVTPQCRLTLTSGTPVMASSVAAATTVFLTPYGGNSLPTYDGVRVANRPFTELSLTTTDSTKSPAAVGASKVYDAFAWPDPATGDWVLSRGPEWTNTTTRGYTFTEIEGLLWNTSTITNGPAALRGLWVGTIASNGSSTIDYIFGAAASGGTAARLMVWNAYNRVDVGAIVTDSASFTSSSATIQQFHNGSAGMQIGFVLGAQQDAIQFSFNTEVVPAAVVGAFTIVGVGFDTTTAFSVARSRVQNTAAQALVMPAAQSGIWSAGIGTHVLSLNQQSDGSNSNQFNNTASAFLAASIRV
jgi:hypothetical protein